MPIEYVKVPFMGMISTALCIGAVYHTGPGEICTPGGWGVKIKSIFHLFFFNFFLSVKVISLFGPSISFKWAISVVQLVHLVSPLMDEQGRRKSFPLNSASYMMLASLF